MTPFAALLLLQATPNVAPEREIVVTARPLAETEKSLRDCLARNCPPDQEVAAALAHAENQFVGGEYRSARGTVQRTIDRVRGRAEEYPVPVGDIWRAKARITEHQGESDTVRIAQAESLDALRAGLRADDPRVLAQRLELGDVMARLGRPLAALGFYEVVIDRARRANNKLLEGHALLRVAMMWASYADVEPVTYDRRARDALARLNATTAIELSPFRDAGQLLAAKLDAKAGDAAAVDRLIATFRTKRTARPVLLHSPPFGGSASADPKVVRTGSGAFPTTEFEDQWVDVGFWVRPDGTVADVQTLRSSGKLRGDWVEAIRRQVAGRRYAPLAMARDEPGLLRVERVTWTSHYFTPTGTRMRIRDGVPRMVVLDLTDDAEAAGKGDAEETS